jgi:hypothetical protein
VTGQTYPNGAQAVSPFSLPVGRLLRPNSAELKSLFETHRFVFQIDPESGQVLPLEPGEVVEVRPVEHPEPPSVRADEEFADISEGIFSISYYRPAPDQSNRSISASKARLSAAGEVQVRVPDQLRPPIEKEAA